MFARVWWGREEQVEHGGYLGQCDIIMHIGHFAFVQTHRMHNTQSEP